MSVDDFCFEYLHYVAGSMVRLDDAYERYLTFLPVADRADWTLDRFRREIVEHGCLIGRGGGERRLGVGTAAWFPQQTAGPGLVLIKGWLREKPQRILTQGAE